MELILSWFWWGAGLGSGTPIESIPDIHRRWYFVIQRGIDLDMHFGFREEVTKALIRKAELLAKEGSSFYVEVLTRMGLS